MFVPNFAKTKRHQQHLKTDQNNYVKVSAKPAIKAKIPEAFTLLMACKSRGTSNRVFCATNKHFFLLSDNLNKNCLKDSNASEIL
ncbi:hypothetical protein PV325_008310 [Microctonus aethiopoides]|nr:hypothetical protein PV325_008310 [Microctonus aethiopoides]